MEPDIIKIEKPKAYKSCFIIQEEGKSFLIFNLTYTIWQLKGEFADNDYLEYGIIKEDDYFIYITEL